MADTGQAETQDGSTQCRQETFMKAKPSSSLSFFSPVPDLYILMTFRVWPEMSRGVSQRCSSVENSGGMPLASLHAATQALQPMHRVLS